MDDKEKVDILVNEMEWLLKEIFNLNRWKVYSIPTDSLAFHLQSTLNRVTKKTEEDENEKKA